MVAHAFSVVYSMQSFQLIDGRKAPQALVCVGRVQDFVSNALVLIPVLVIVVVASLATSFCVLRSSSRGSS